MILRVLLCVCVVLAISSGSPTSFARTAEPRIHVVYRGQHLGMIAKRYRVTVEALRSANDLAPGDPIKPGQQLIIPSADDSDGSKTRAAAAKKPKKPAATTKPRQPAKPKARQPARPVRKAPPRTHRVAPRQHLGMIAKRYQVTVDAIRHANELSSKALIKPGQELTIPWPEDIDGSAAQRFARDRRANKDKPSRTAGRNGRAQSSRKSKKGASWKDYRRPAWKRGYLTLQGPNGTWKGYVIDPNGKVIGNARKAFNKILATSDGKTILINRRLIRLLAQVSDTFGGRPFRVVSGYRLESTARRSRHKTGHALDFSIPGVPNEALRDYVKRFPKVGVGYYPNSSFIHLDVRDRWTYWIDYSGPGQAPRYGRISNRRPPR